MSYDLSGLEYQTDQGIWRVSYRWEPDEAIDSGRVVYHLRFKWIDPNNPNNELTPERHLTLELLREDLIGEKAKETLRNALGLWISEALPTDEARFDSHSPYLLKPRARENAN
jgi:hypothetical protein